MGSELLGYILLLSQVLRLLNIIIFCLHDNPKKEKLLLFTLQMRKQAEREEVTWAGSSSSEKQREQHVQRPRVERLPGVSKAQIRA